MLLLSRCITFRLSELQFYLWTVGKDSNLILDIKVDTIVHVFIRTMSLSIKPHHSVSSLTGTILAHSGSTVWKYFRFRVSVTNQQQITCKEGCRVASATQSNKHQSNCHQCSGCLWLKSDVTPSTSQRPTEVTTAITSTKHGESEGFGKMVNLPNNRFVSPGLSAFAPLFRNMFKHQVGTTEQKWKQWPVYFTLCNYFYLYFPSAIDWI